MTMTIDFPAQDFILASLTRFVEKLIRKKYIQTIIRIIELPEILTIIRTRKYINLIQMP